MKGGRIAERIMFGIVGLVILVWIGYHMFNTYRPTLETETVYEYTKTQSIPARGIAIRQEMVLDQRVAGIENYLFEDGERAMLGQNVAEFYDSAGSDRNIKRMREIQSEIEMLTVAQDKSINNYSNADNLNRDIRDQLGRLSIMSETGSFGDSSAVRESLTSLLNRRQIATGKASGFERRIAALEGELAGLRQNTSGNAMVAAATPVTGYFAKTVDGYEKYVSPALLKDYGIDEYARLIRGTVAEPEVEYTGKIITSQNWYFAVTLKTDYTDPLAKGQKVTLEFPDRGERVSAVVYDVLIDKDKDDAAVIFQSDIVNAATVNMRVEDVNIHVVEVTGLRINTSCIRYVDNVQGVYVVENSVVQFKEIKPIYEEAGFVLTKMNVNETPDYRTDEVRLYQQVVTKGTDLYDGKTLS